MTPTRARAHFLLLAIVLFTCFFVGMRIGWDVSERAYVVLVYGWENAHKHGLHVTRSKPVFVISNGDRASVVLRLAFIGSPLRSNPPGHAVRERRRRH